jgi:type IV secretory pathway VirJ component
MGADALPFIINRLPGELKSKIDLIVFLGLGATADFQFHLSSWLGKSGADALPVMPELEKLIGIKMLCVYGENDRDVPCKALSAGLVETEMLEGGHRIGGNFEPVAAKILSIIPQ